MSRLRLGLRNERELLVLCQVSLSLRVRTISQVSNGQPATYLYYESDSCKVFQNKPLNLVSPAHLIV